MSDERLDALAETARNRGLKLVRSRVRTPGKRGFGKVGLTDASGKPVFGMDAKGPMGSPDDAELYLRNLGAKDWGVMIEGHGGALDRMDSPPKPKEKPKPKLRDAKPSDAPRLAELIHFLGHEISEKAVRKNIAALKKAGETPLVATLDKRVVGMIGMHRMITIHRDAPVGRIPVLVVSKEAQGLGLGRMLVDAAEQWCRKKGCKLIEVTSNDRRAEAHAFYQHIGYERTSVRFFKKL